MPQRDKPSRRCGVLLWFFAEAVRSELENRWERADFFFDQAAAEFERLKRGTGAWDTIARALGEPEAELTKDPEVLRKRLVEEYFVDTHIALFNGHAAGKDSLAADERAFTHLTRLQTLLPASSLSLAERHTLLQQPLEQLVAVQEKARQWDAAIQTAEALIQLAPRNLRHENQLVDLVFSRAVAEVNPSEDEAVNRGQARQLQQRIGELERLRSRFADNSDIYESLAALHHLRGVKLANAAALSDALLEVQKALLLQPSSTAANETWKQLVATLENLQKQMAELEAKIGRQPNLGLNEKGQELRRIASTGFKEVTAYSKSEAAVQLAAAATRARDRSLWRSIGLPEPAVDWDNRASALLAGMNRVAAREPVDRSAIAAEWKKTQRDFPELALLDSGAICRFLASRLLSEEKEEAAPETELSAPKIEASAPVLERSQGASRGGGAPFSFWLTSPIDLGIKAGWATTIALIVFATTVHVRDTNRREHRAKAYAALSAAVANNNHRAALEAAEDFFDARPLAQDDRDSEVSALAQESFVRWITQQAGELTAADGRLIDRFRKLIPQQPANHP